jgi:hypothetical protein
MATKFRSAAKCRDVPRTDMATKRFGKPLRLKTPAVRPGVLSFHPGTTGAHNASGVSCCQRLITPATAAPMMGASQNNQSCAYAPPANNAGPVLRAGLIEALVTGIRKR